MMARPPRGVSERGLSLVELAVAILVLSLGTVAALRATSFAGRGISEEAARTIARQVALNRAEELRLHGPTGLAELPATETIGRIDWTVTHEAEATEGGFLEVRIAVTAPGRPGAQLVTYLAGGGVP